MVLLSINKHTSLKTSKFVRCSAQVFLKLLNDGTTGFNSNTTQYIGKDAIRSWSSPPLIPPCSSPQSYLFASKPLITPNRPPRNVMEARLFVAKSAKSNNFSQAEHAFTQLCDMIRFRPRHSDNDNLRRRQKKPTIVKYKSTISKKPLAAWYDMHPTLQQSIDYACLCLQVPEPLRDFNLEITVTGYLILFLNRSSQPGGKGHAPKLAEEGVS
ncbi:hypothetical protein BC941DRAFT_475033 [Chlamydoabsidia padenii]|nr:hypothetical protein BC941DRAFT_475033 [Chlamydoabsidia padenii]